MGKVKFNIKNVHYAVLENGTYGTPVAIPGAVSLTCDPQSEDNTFYADGIAYYKSYNSQGYEGDLEIAVLPDSFRIDVLGDTMDSKNVLIENALAPQKTFALGFQIDGNEGSTYFWFYNCTASRPTVEANTNTESIEPDTDSLEWTCMPDADGIVRAKSTSTTAAADIASWFTAVYTPDIQ